MNRTTTLNNSFCSNRYFFNQWRYALPLGLGAGITYYAFHQKISYNPTSSPKALEAGKIYPMFYEISDKEGKLRGCLTGTIHGSPPNGTITFDAIHGMNNPESRIWKCFEKTAFYAQEGSGLVGVYNHFLEQKFTQAEIEKLIHDDTAIGLHFYREAKRRGIPFIPLEKPRETIPSNGDENYEPANPMQCQEKWEKFIYHPSESEGKWLRKNCVSPMELSSFEVREKNMTQRIDKLLADGFVFALVGTVHTENMAHLLKDKGWTVQLQNVI